MVVSLVAVSIGVPLVAYSVWSSSTKLTYRRVPRGPKAARILVVLTAGYVLTVTVVSEYKAIGTGVGKNITTPSTVNWAGKDGLTDSLWVYDAWS